MEEDNWKEIVKKFQNTLPEKGYWSVKSTCDFLLEYFNERSRVIDYLTDCIDLSFRLYRFHQKWAPKKEEGVFNPHHNLRHLAQYQLEEVEKSAELLGKILEREGYDRDRWQSI